MHALTVKQPWAEAIARYGKTVENRTRRPPAHLLGKRIAIHVSRTWAAKAEEWRARKPLFWDLDHWTSTEEYQSRVYPYLAPAIELCRQEAVPNAGRIIATARLVGWCTNDSFYPGGLHPDGAIVEAATRSPWFTGPVGWVLADVRVLREPVGDHRCGWHGGCQQPWVGHGPCPRCNMRGSGVIGSIRGQVYPFELSPAVSAAVEAQGG